jgi:beta-adrenergic-receptor kinase
MGCANTKEADDEVARGSGNSHDKRRGTGANLKFVEMIFNTAGQTRKLDHGEELIKQGAESESAYYIKEGKIALMLADESGNKTKLATRVPGDVLGELSLLLGHDASVSAIAEGPVTIIEVKSAALLAMLREDPVQSGRLFKVMATYLSERISEISGKMRSNVTAKSASGPASKSLDMPATDIAKAHAMFQLPKEEKLISVYQCSVRRELNAVKEGNAHFGELYIFERHLCFDLKVFAFHKQWVLDVTEIVAFLKSQDAETPNVVEVQGKGHSYELHIPEHFEEACTIMEACRLQAKTVELQAHAMHEAQEKQQDGLEAFQPMVDSIVATESAAEARQKHRAVDMDLQEEDWKAFLAGAKQRTYAKGEYVLQEGKPTAALFQIIRGTLRVELQLPDQPQAVVVAYRKAGEMFGETSLLQAGVATASIAADSEATVVCIEGTFLEQLFQSNPQLPGRFFCFLAAYQAERLYKLTKAFAESSKPKVTAPNSLRLSIEQVMANAAFCGVFRKYMVKEAEGGKNSPKLQELLRSFDFFVYAQDFKFLPDVQALIDAAENLSTKYISDRSSSSALSYIEKDTIAACSSAISDLKANKLTKSQGRQIFKPVQAKVLAKLESDCFDSFLGSSHYQYILELKDKEGHIPKLDDFKVIRVMGEGGFGQVIDVVKRDCGVHYAMKVMQKEAMKQNLGSSWRKKIAMEQQLMAALEHPFMVNLKYAFQNPEFLILVMDLVQSGDLSEFVLTKKRLTAPQVHWALMETVEVFGYMHSCMIMYRDLKPENLLVDDEGHVRLIDMGLAARFSEKSPKRTSRVGTDCYMAPEVRWARKWRQPYGVSCDWYTVGVLLYEFANGALPYTARDTDSPIYRAGDFHSREEQELCEGLLKQDHKTRLASGRGVIEIKEHAYFKDVDWELVPACKIPSPMKGVKGIPKRKKDKETQAQRTACNIAEADKAEVDSDRVQEYNVGTWDFVSPKAVTEEYMESMYQCVSAI